MRGRSVFPLVSRDAAACRPRSPRAARSARRPRSPHTPRTARSIALGAALTTIVALLLSGCGGGTRQDAQEPKSTFRVRIVKASFPALQTIARPTIMMLQVRNMSARTVPNLAVTIDSFSYVENYPDLAANKRPIWVVEAGPGTVPKRLVQSQAISPPGGGQTAYVNTWALGSLAPGRVRTFLWDVVPVKGGLHTVHFTVAAGLAGNAHAQLAGGAPVTGRFLVHIAPQPPARHVDPNTGKIVPGAYPATP
ncbi:MAG TPA: hypothetical protein VII53_03185 [Solirubrobacteraceae bacterium]